MFAGGGGDFFTAEHAGDFFDAFGFAEGADAGAGGFLVGVFADLQVLMGLGGDLGQVGDAQDLVVAAEGLELLADGFGDGAADTAVDFVEDQGRDVCVAGGDHLDGEADAGQFATGGGFCQGL